MRVVLPALLALALPLPAQEAAEPPAKKEIKALLAEYLELDRRDEGTAARRAAIIARLDLVPLDKAKDVKTWRKELDKLWSKGVELEKKSGRHFFWEDEERGLYYVGGETKKPKGLLIGMHGGGVGSGDASGPWQSMGGPAKDQDWVGIFPEVLEKTERGWTDSGTEEWVMDLIDAAMRTWDIDPDQVYLSGHSMGGYGTWLLGAHHADRVAGLAASAGAPTPVYGPDGTIIQIDDGVVPNLRNTRMVVFQSTDDPKVLPDANQAAVRDVEKAKKRWGGYEGFEYLEVHDRGHGYPEGGLGVLFEAITEARRESVPERLVWQPTLDWKRQHYYLYWPTPARNAIVEARLDRAENTLRVLSRADLKGMELLLDERVLDLEREVVIVVNGEETHRGMARPTLGSMVLSYHGRDLGRQFLARLPFYPEG
jgi:pimeloyl-ACP methyl ester carboxylesterase